MTLRRIPMVMVFLAVASVALTICAGGPARANIKIVITESDQEGIGKLEETDATGKTTKVCGFPGMAACVVGQIRLPVPIGGAGIDIIDVDIPGTNEKISDSIGFGILPGGIINGITGFSSPGGSDNSAGDTEIGHTKSLLGATVDITIISPAEGNATGAPELSTWAMMLIGFGLCARRLVRLRKFNLKRSCSTISYLARLTAIAMVCSSARAS